MSVLSTHNRSRQAWRGLAIGLIGAGLLGAASPARAATWGHLRGPFAPESLIRERLNYAAEARAERRARGEIVLVQPSDWQLQRDPCLIVGRQPVRSGDETTRGKWFPGFDREQI